MLPPWAEGPFELLLHGEVHFRAGADFDRRMALISFDNAIEAAIACHLSLDEVQRGGRKYEDDQIREWRGTFDKKLGLIEHECSIGGLSWEVERSYIVYYHRARNEAYHESRPTLPNTSILQGIRRAAIWIFELLYAVSNTEELLEQRILAQAPPRQLIERDPSLDEALDEQYGIISIGDLQFSVSELLFAADRTAYIELANTLLADRTRSVEIAS